jgi:hypothetical protein
VLTHQKLPSQQAAVLQTRYMGGHPRVLESLVEMVLSFWQSSEKWLDKEASGEV